MSFSSDFCDKHFHLFLSIAYDCAYLKDPTFARARYHFPLSLKVQKLSTSSQKHNSFPPLPTTLNLLILSKFETQQKINQDKEHTLELDMTSQLFLKNRYDISYLTHLFQPKPPTPNVGFFRPPSFCFRRRLEFLVWIQQLELFGSLRDIEIPMAFYLRWMFPKIMGKNPPNHPLKNRVLTWFSPSILGCFPIFGNTQVKGDVHEKRCWKFVQLNSKYIIWVWPHQLPQWQQILNFNFTWQILRAWHEMSFSRHWSHFRFNDKKHHLHAGAKGLDLGFLMLSWFEFTRICWRKRITSLVSLDMIKVIHVITISLDIFDRLSCYISGLQ